MNIFFNLIAWAFPTKDIEKIVGVLLKTVVRLQQAEEQHTGIVLAIDDEIKNLLEAKAEAEAAAQKAKRIADNITSIIS